VKPRKIPNKSHLKKYFVKMPAKNYYSPKIVLTRMSYRNGAADELRLQGISWRLQEALRLYWIPAALLGQPMHRWALIGYYMQLEVFHWSILSCIRR
jgi:hypothetical protein